MGMKMAVFMGKWILKLFQSQVVKFTVNDRSTRMNKLKRLIWCALLFGIQALYFPLNRFLQGGLELKIPLDQYMPP